MLFAEADSLIGSCNVIVVPEPDGPDMLGEIVRGNVDGVVRTMTCIRFES